MQKLVLNKPILSVNSKLLKENGISPEKLNKYFPRYILNPTPLYCWGTRKTLFSINKFFWELWIKIFLRPRKSQVGNLNLSEVNKVYSKEAGTYNYKHHNTTAGMDLMWRRMAGWFASTVGRNGTNPLKILDLCTGTGLTIKEMSKILSEWDIDADFIGLDYNKEMLNRAKNNERTQFVRGDAMSLKHLQPNSFHLITQVFGIGGISDPLKVFNGVLRILKPGGHFFMVDIHRPIPEHSGEWWLIIKWHRLPILSSFVHEKITIPLVLNRLWGWHDATLYFYLLPLITYKGSDCRFWGFKVHYFEQEPQRWWFSMPVMPIGKIIVKKVEISEKIARIRKTILEACSHL